MESWRLLAELVGLLSLALVLGLVAARLGQKAIIGYLVAGLVAGPRGLGIVKAAETVQFLAELGVALLLFSIGLEFSWHRIAAFGRKVVVGGLLQFGLTWTCGFAVGHFAGLTPAGSVALGSILALSSTAFVMRLLQDRSELDSRHGRQAVGILLLQDLLLVPLLVIQSVLAERQSGWAGVAAFGVQFGKGVLLVALFYVVIRLVVMRALRGANSYAERDVPVLLSVLACMGCAWGSHVAGLSPVLGAFVAGVLLADQPMADQIRANVTPLRAIFITLFFTSIGMLAGLPRASEWLLVAMLSAGVVVVKATAATAAIRWSGNPLRVAVLGGVALAQIGEFSFVLAQDALKRGLLPAGASEPLMTASVLTLIATPYLFPVGEWVARRLRKVQVVESMGERRGAVDAIVVGYGPAGLAVVIELIAAGLSLRVIEANSALAATVEGADVLVGDATSEEILTHAGLSKAKVLILTIPDPGAARTILGVARSLNANIEIVVRARYHRYADVLRRLGTDALADEEVLVGGELARGALALLERA